MLALISLVLALATPIMQDSGSLVPDEQKIFDMSPKAGVVTINVRGDGQGDLDCYIIENDRIVDRDESREDSCSFQVHVKSNRIRLWVRNNGYHQDTYTVRAEWDKP